MPTFRHDKKGKVAFTRILNAVLQDHRLSWKARGLMSYMLSKPNNFKFYLHELTKHAPDGLDGVKTGIKELEKFGYVKRYSIKERGKIVSWEMNVYEVPQVDKPQVEKPLVENPTLITNELITNDLITNDKRYIVLPNDDIFMDIYNQAFKHKYGKPHMKVKVEQLRDIEEQIGVMQSYDIDTDTWREKVEEHFDNLPENNNGNIIAFLSASFRYFEVGQYS